MLPRRGLESPHVDAGKAEVLHLHADICARRQGGVWEILRKSRMPIGNQKYDQSDHVFATLE